VGSAPAFAGRLLALVSDDPAGVSRTVPLIGAFLPLPAGP
jgi:hypothetical protein